MKLATLLVFLAVATVSGDDSFGDDSFSRPGGQVNGRLWRGWAAVESGVTL